MPWPMPLRSLAGLPDPLGRVLERREIEDGIELTRVSVPLGVVAMVYEARPNVTADAAGICLKSGNACVLRGGSQALHSNAAIVSALREAVVSAGLPPIAFPSSIPPIARRPMPSCSFTALSTCSFLTGGAGLIRHCIECSKEVPVIETGYGRMPYLCARNGRFRSRHHHSVNAQNAARGRVQCMRITSRR